jgi:putative hydrolase of the HAD superfamily
MARLNVVFDFGAVLFAWQPHVLVREYFPERTATEEATASLAHSIFAHPDWQAFDAGTASMFETIDRVQQRTGLPVCQLRNLVHGIGERLAPLPSSVNVLRSLRERRDSYKGAGQDIKLFYLSNMPEPYARALELKHDFIGWFDDGIFSADVKLAKPDAAIYALCTQRFGLQGADTVFIDDMLPNIAAARAHGWRALHLPVAEALEADLLNEIGLWPKEMLHE